MKADLRNRLIAANTSAQDRFYWLERPQGDGLPAATLQVISPGRHYHHGGADALHDTRVQADCWGRNHNEAYLLSREVIAALEPAATVGATTFSNSFQDGARDFDPESLAGGVKVFRVSLDFIVWHQPAS